MPWQLLDRYQGWLISYSGLLGAVGGVIACDYLLRGLRLRVEDLYAERGEYTYGNGINGRAMVALAAGIGTALLGKLLPAASFLFDAAWFSAATVSAVVYWALMRSLLSSQAVEPHGNERQ